MSALHVSLDQFEGPLGLLLYLIRKEEMDIYDIQVHLITEHYLEHIKQMKELDLEGASEFITMAATLIHIKSKMLLPTYNEEGEEDLEDPRKELVQRLLEYQKYQEAAKNLNEKPLLGRDMWPRGMKEDLSVEFLEEDVEVDEKGLFGLISTYRKMVTNFQGRVHKVVSKAQSISDRIMELKDYLIPGKRITMKELMAPFEKTRTRVVVTFISLLEMGKLGFVRVYQTEPFSDIHVDTLREVHRDIIKRVDDYDSGDASQIRENLGLGDMDSLPAEEVHVDLNLEEGEPVNGEEQPHIQRVIDDGTPEESASDKEILLAENELGLRENVDLTEKLEPEDEQLNVVINKDTNHDVEA